MARYPELAWKEPLLLSKQCASVTKEYLYAWFDELKTHMEESGHGYILELPERIFNADETGFLLAPKPLKVITAKGEPHVYQQGTSSKTQITCLMAHNAVGQYVNPMLVFPGKNFHHEFLNNFYHHNPSAVFRHSSNGWMDVRIIQDVD